MSNLTLDELVEKIVREDVYCNVDSLVRYSLEKSNEDSTAPIGYEDIENEMPDFYGMTKKQLKAVLREEHSWNRDDWEGMDHADLVSACEENHEMGEVYEYWAVSDWLYRKLKGEGEIVINAYPNIWGRCTTGQAITLDGVMRRIASDLMRK